MVEKMSDPLNRIDRLVVKNPIEIWLNRLPVCFESCGSHFLFRSEEVMRDAYATVRLDVHALVAKNDTTRVLLQTLESSTALSALGDYFNGSILGLGFAAAEA